MRRWLITLVAMSLTLAVAFSLPSFVGMRSASAETVLLLDSSPAKPLDTSKSIFTDIGLTTVSRSDVYTDAAKFNNLTAYRMAVLYQWSTSWGGGAPGMPDWAKNALNNYVNAGGLLLGTGVDEVSRGYNGGGDYNWMNVFHLTPGTPIDIMTNTGTWQVRAVMEQHPIANGPYGSYSGTFGTNAYTDADGGLAGTGAYNVFEMQGWGGSWGGGGNWYCKICVWQRDDNKGTTIWWNGNGNSNQTYGEMVGEWTGGVMVPAFQNIMYWFMGLAGYELTVSTDAEANSVGFPKPAVGLNPTPRGMLVNASVTSPWAYPGINDERFSCLGWTGDGVVVPASGTGSAVSFNMTGNGWLSWHWRKEYQIVVTSSQQIGVPNTEFTVWHPADTVASIFTTKLLTTADPDLGWRLSGWVGSGSVPAEGLWAPDEDSVLVFFCSGPGTIEWQWTQTYRFRVFNPRNVGLPSPPTGDNFFDQNTTLLATVQDQVYESASVRYLTDGFEGTGAVPTGGMNNAVSFILYTPSTITWRWKNEFRLDVVNPSKLGNPVPAEGFYWYPQETSVNCSVTSPVSSGGVNYFATGYYLNGVAYWFDQYTNPSIQLTMSGPNEIRWIFQPSDITLNIASEFGSPTPAVGAHQYSFGEEVTVSVQAIVAGASGDQRHFCTGFTAIGEGVPSQWAGNTLPNGDKDYTYTFVLRENPTSITWTWSTQYLLTIVSSLPGVPSVPALGTHWYDMGTIVHASVPRYLPQWACDGFTVQAGDVTPSSRNYLSVTMNEPISLTWTWSERANAPLFPAFDNIETVSENDPNWGRYCSLAKDTVSGNPHIAYYRSYPDGGGSLYHTYHDGLRWITELVDGRGAEAAKVDGAADSPDAGMHTSIAIDSNGRPHISYFDASNGNLKYATRTIGGNWIVSTVDDGGGPARVGEFSSLVLNKFNEPSIAYFNRTAGNLLYAKLDANGWQIETPALQGNVGSYPRLALDPITQRPRIAYRDNDRNWVLFVYHDGTAWKQIVVDDSGNAGNSLGMALDSNGMAHVAYQLFLGATNRLVHAIQAGDQFFSTVVEENRGTGYFPAIDILPGNFPVIAYNDQELHALRYAFFDGSMWHRYTVDASGESVGWYVSLSLAGDAVSIAYWSNTGLRYTTLEHKSQTSNPGVDAGTGSSGGGGCFIATASFGSLAVDSVCALTAVRDASFADAEQGRALVAVYYAASPVVARQLSGSTSAVLRRFIDSLVR